MFYKFHFSFIFLISPLIYFDKLFHHVEFFYYILSYYIIFRISYRII